MFWEWRRFEDLEEKAESVNERMNELNQGWSWHPEVLFHSNSGYSKEQTFLPIQLAQDTSGRQKFHL